MGSRRPRNRGPFDHRDSGRKRRQAWSALLDPALTPGRGSPSGCGRTIVLIIGRGEREKHRIWAVETILYRTVWKAYHGAGAGCVWTQPLHGLGPDTAYIRHANDE